MRAKSRARRQLTLLEKQAIRDEFAKSNELQIEFDNDVNILPSNDTNSLISNDSRHQLLALDLMSRTNNRLSQAYHNQVQVQAARDEVR